MRGDLEWGTTPRLVQSAAERFGDSEAVVDGDVRMSFADLATAGHRAARAFMAAGVEPPPNVPSHADPDGDSRHYVAARRHRRHAGRRQLAHGDHRQALA